MRSEPLSAPASFRVWPIPAGTSPGFRAKFAEAGGLISYSPDFDDLFRQAAAYVDKILRGTNPGNLPVQQASKFKLVVNLKTAEALGLTVPSLILAQADEVIE